MQVLGILEIPKASPLRRPSGACAPPPAPKRICNKGQKEQNGFGMRGAGKDRATVLLLPSEKFTNHPFSVAQLKAVVFCYH